MDPIDWLVDVFDWMDDTIMDTVLTGLGILFLAGCLIIEGIYQWDRIQQRRSRE